MKWIYILVCFISTNTFCQLNNKSVLGKLKQTDLLIHKPNSENLQRDTIVHRFNQNRQEIIIPENRERVIIALRQDNMPCIVPNMKLFNNMPNVGDIAMLQQPINPGIYVPRLRNDHKINPLMKKGPSQ